MLTNRLVSLFSCRIVLCRLVVALAVLAGVAPVAAPVAAAGAGKPQFYTDSFSFQLERADLTETCGFPIRETVNGEVSGWDRYNADGTYAGGSVQVTVTGTYYSDWATLSFSGKTRNLDRINADGSDSGVVLGVYGLVVVPGEGAVFVETGRVEVLFPAGGGEPTLVARSGHDNGDAFFGAPGNPGTICALLAP
jgi:hypothetical protein